MNKEKGKDEGDGVDFDPQWPQRPGRPQPEQARPHFDPPDGEKRRAASQDGGRAHGAASKWTSYPVSKGDSQDGGDASKETRVLPVVEPSRFDNGGRRGPTHAPTARPQPTTPPGQVEQGPSAQTQAPQGRRPGGWQYERDEAEYDEQPPNTYASPQRGGKVPTIHARGAWKDGGTSPSYISMEIEGARKRRGGWILWVLGGVLALALVGAIAFSLAWQGQYAGKVYAGVSVLGMDMGGKTPDEAKKLIQDKVQAFVAQPVVLTWRGKEWRPSADQLGVKVDIDSTVSEAFGVGRTSDLIGNVSQQWSSAQSGYAAPLTVQLSEPALQTYLETIAGNEIDQKLFEGDIRLNGAQIVSMPGKEGRRLRVYEAISAVRDSVAKLEPAKVELPVEVVQPTVSAEEVAYIDGLLGVRISGPITATAMGKTFALDRDALVRVTTIERNPDRNASRHIELGWKDNELKLLGDKWASEAARPAQNARFAWNNGSVSVLSESIEGFQTDPASIIASIKEHSGTSDKREYDLPGRVITPTVSSKDIGALGIKELMGTGTSTFKGSSPERATNIQVAANLLNGAVVPPGGTFSFLQTMGGIDEAHGFVEGYVIAAERTQKGVGGGVCQVSTTTFRAAFWSGVQITERNQHSYRVGWYEANGEPVGFDAAVFDPGVDMKFVNTTPNYMLVQAVVTPGLLTVNFYGTKLPGEIKLEGPAISNRVPAPPDVYEVDTRLPAGTKKQVETAHGGLDTVITRRIVAPGQPDKADQFYSSYRAWPNWFIVASSSQVPSGGQPVAQPTPNP